MNRRQEIIDIEEIMEFFITRPRAVHNGDILRHPQKVGFILLWITKFARQIQGKIAAARQLGSLPPLGLRSTTPQVYPCAEKRHDSPINERFDHCCIMRRQSVGDSFRHSLFFLANASIVKSTRRSKYRKNKATLHASLPPEIPGLT